MDLKQRRRLHRTYERIFYAGQEILEIPMIRGGAGSYPDAPSRRMALDADGSILTTQNWTDKDPVVERAGSVRTEMNDEDNVAGITYANQKFARTHWVFPEFREIDGFFVGQDLTGSGTNAPIHTSGDTTNTIDGSWTQRVAAINEYTSVYPDNYRDNITSLAVSNARAIRHYRQYWNTGSFPRHLKCWHLYGEISAAETPDRLLWFDNDDDLEFSKPVDYGDKPRGSAEDHIVYLKNNSASLSAGTVQVTAEDLYLGSGAWFTFDDGTGFASTKTLASSIANGANSPDITIRCIRPDAAQLGLHAARAYANVGSWT